MSAPKLSGESLRLVSATTIPIQKSVPLPARASSGTWPFAHMEVGDSFAVPAGSEDRATAAGKEAGRRRGWKFSCRTVLNDDGRKGLRIWRVA